MDPNSGKLFPSLADAIAAGVTDAVKIEGSAQAVEKISNAVRAAQSEQRRRKRKAQKKARRTNR